jgi:hypothetical protein
MENQVTVFENRELGKVRTCLIDDNPWFVAKDVYCILGYKNTRDAIKKHASPKDVAKCDTLTRGGMQKLLYVNESGIYTLIFGSKLPAAEDFKHWVTSEVLPSIRKTGSYGANSEVFGDFMKEAISDRIKLDVLARICRGNEYLGKNTVLVGSFPEFKDDDLEKIPLTFPVSDDDVEVSVTKAEARIRKMDAHSPFNAVLIENQYDKERMWKIAAIQENERQAQTRSLKIRLKRKNDKRKLQNALHRVMPKEMAAEYNI